MKRVTTTLLVPTLALMGVMTLGALTADAAGFGQALSDNQREEIKELRENGATRIEIKEQLQEWGVEVSNLRKRGFKRAISQQLTDNQKQEIKEMKEAGASREEIKEQLNEWDITIPEHPLFSQLSDEQREVLQDLKDDGATREEVKEQLEDWGIERPEKV